MNTKDLDHAKTAATLKTRLSQGWHDIDVSHLDWATTEMDLHVHHEVFKRIWGEGSLQYRMACAYKRILGNMTAAYVLSDGTAFRPPFVGRVDSGEWITLWRNNLTMLYCHLLALKNIGYCQHHSDEECAQKKCLHISFMGDDGAIDTRPFKLRPDVLTSRAYVEEFLRCGKVLKFDEDKSFCSREMIDVMLSRAKPGIPASEDQKIKVLQNIKPEKSLAKLYVNMVRFGEASEEYVSAQTSFFKNFCFYDREQIKKLWADFQLPNWEQHQKTYEELMFIGAKQRLIEAPRPFFPIEYTDRDSE